MGRSLRDIRADEVPFSGVAMVFGGDSRHIPPVSRHGIRAQIVDASLKRSPLRVAIRRRRLSRVLIRCQRMGGVGGAGGGASYLGEIGDGGDIAKGEGNIELPPNFGTDAAAPPVRSQR